MVMYTRWEIELYPDGVRRAMIAPLIRVHKEHFIAWDDIESLTATTCRPSAQAGDKPLIAIGLRTPREPIQHKMFDTPDRIGIPVYLLACEPNTLLAIMWYLKEHPAQRQLVARPDAAVWFAPPTLRERDRLFREAEEEIP